MGDIIEEKLENLSLTTALTMMKLKSKAMEMLGNEVPVGIDSMVIRPPTYPEETEAGSFEVIEEPQPGTSGNQEPIEATNASNNSNTEDRQGIEEIPETIQLSNSSNEIDVTQRFVVPEVYNFGVPPVILTPGGMKIVPEFDSPAETPFNTRPLSIKAETYDLETFQKNAMIIFNHENLEGFSKRSGTAEDVAALRETFEKFGFEIAVHDDLTKVRLFEELKKFSETNFTEYGCVAVVILTHGTGNGLLRARDEGQIYSETDVINLFKVSSRPTLVGKPFLLMIQACRGNSSTRGVPVNAQYKIDTDHDELPTSYYLPVESDMLIVHSSFAGKPSYRPHTGSWFIQTLCNQINCLYFKNDLESILTKTKHEVATEKYYMQYNSKTQEMDVNKQTPVVTTTLIRKLFLRKYGDDPPKVMNYQTEKSYDDNMNNVKDNPDGKDSCACYIKQFHYMKKCLRHFVEEHPEDSTAQDLLSLADFENGVHEDKTKKTLATISNYLKIKFRKSENYKYIHFYSEENDTDALDDSDTLELNTLLKYFTRIWTLWANFCRDHTATILGVCVAAILYQCFR